MNHEIQETAHSFPRSGYVRLSQIIGTHAASPRRKIEDQEPQSPDGDPDTDSKKRKRKTEAPFYEPFIPVSKSTWWAGVKSGRYPAPARHLGSRITAWNAEKIWELVE